MINEQVFFQLSHELSLSGMIFFDLDKMKIIFSNQQVVSSLCENLEDGLVGQSVFDFVALKEMDREILKTDGFYGELTLVRHDGREFPVLASIKIKTHQNLNLGIMSFQDLSAQKKILRDLTAKHEGLTEILQELNEKNEALLKLDKAKDKFLSLISHELRTPLNTIVATSEIIYNKIYDTDEEYNELSKNLYFQSNHMLDLVNDILDMTKIHSGKMEFYVERRDPCELLEEQKSLFVDMAKENQVEIVFERPTIPLLCYFDDMRFKQIIVNLISNAIKFNKPGGKIMLSLVDKVDIIEISVTDEGLGIPNDKFESIFNEFETIESISNHHKGTGLGLSIVRSLIRGLGGNIRLESTLGHGTTFFISLPKEKVLQESVYRSREAGGVFLFDDSSEKS